jgi:hypothetical protein
MFVERGPGSLVNLLFFIGCSACLSSADSAVIVISEHGSSTAKKSFVMTIAKIHK